MDSIRKAFAVAIKELRVFSADRGVLFTMFLLPLLIGFFTTSMFAGETSGIQLPTIIVNQDSGEYGETISKTLAGIEQLELLALEAVEDAEQRVATGEYLAAVVIPADFTQRIDAYQPSQVSVIVDPAQASYARIVTTIMDEVNGALAIQGEIRYGIREVLSEMGFDETDDPNLARAAQAQVEGVLFTQMQVMQTDNPILIESETLSGDQVFYWENAFSLVLPAMTVMFAFFVVPSLSATLIKEKEDGSLRRLIAAPLPRSALIGGKMLGYLLVVLIQVVLIFGIGVVFLDMPLGKSPLALIIVTIALGLTATTLGMLVAATARSMDQATSIGLLIVFALGFLGGSLTPAAPLYRGEGLLAMISRYTPQAQAQLAYFGVLIQNAGLMEVLPYIAYMLGLSAILFLLAVWRLRFEG
jgi:ABC-2 type transport system permease protein